MAIFLLLVTLAVFVFFACVTGEFAWIIASILFGIFVVLNILQEIKMARLDRGKKSKTDISWGNLIVVYVCLVIFSLLLGTLIGNINDRVHSVSTMATISRIESDGNASDDSQETCTGYAKYTVNGKEYESKYTSSSIVCNKRIGTRIKIYYRKDKPGKVTTTQNLIILIFATLFVGFCTALVIKKAYKDEKGRKRGNK